MAHHLPLLCDSVCSAHAVVSKKHQFTVDDADELCVLFCFSSAEAELHRQLATMSIRTDTLRVRTKRETLERKIGEVEEAIKIFSRPKVFVKMET